MGIFFLIKIIKNDIFLLGIKKYFTEQIVFGLLVDEHKLTPELETILCPPVHGSKRISLHLDMARIGSVLHQIYLVILVKISFPLIFTTTNFETEEITDCLGEMIELIYQM